MKKNYSLVSLFLVVYGFAIAQPTQPANPAGGNENNCTTNAAILSCPQNSSNIQTSFTGGIYNRGNNSNHLGIGAIWRFTNITTVAGEQVNAEIKIDTAVYAILENIDDNSQVTSSFFAPRITPHAVNGNTTINGSSRGYIQFTIKFYKNTAGGFTNVQSLTNLNFVHLDIDGNGNSNAWFRETGVAFAYNNSSPQIIANAGTELVSYTYTDNTTKPNGLWKGYAGSVHERDNVSTCAEVAVAYRYLQGARDSISFRMGYDYKGTGNPSSEGTRQYGATFGCFNFSTEIPLPVKLLSFSGSYHNQSTLLNWETEEVNIDHYEIERSSNGSDFTAIINRSGQNGSGVQYYQYTDDLSNANGMSFYYRLKMTDIDYKIKYSNVIVIRKDIKNINGISITPNPVNNSSFVNVRLTAFSNGIVNLRVIDLAGKVVLSQQHKVYEGNNSILINNLDQFKPGVYILQVNDDGTLLTNRFSIIR